VVKARPKRIVSLSPTATETLFAVGAGPQVVAVDSNSNYPAEAPKTNLSGFKPNSEAILKYEPDLVVLARGAQDVIDDLKKAGVTVLFEAAALDFADAENQFRDLGTATGHAPAGQALAAKVRQELADIAASTPKPARQVSLYWELSTTYFSATSKTFIGKVLSTLGTTNIADGASSKVEDYPQLSSEYIVSSDPDLILLADTKGAKQSAETVGARSGWSQMAAVKNGDIVGLDDDIASRWGPRLPELLRAVAAAVQKVAARR
jgi:iron complex transport system substrate-binding protein